MIRCYIADRNLRGIHEPADWVQIRDKNFSARDLFALARRAIRDGPAAKVIINTRMDVALAAGAAGLHLPGDSIAPMVFRRIAPAGFLIGKSCHSIDEVRAAEQQGADYVLFGPVFAPLSKVSDLAPRGLNQLAQAAQTVKIPVLALGGITRENMQACIDAGAAGIAAISFFEKALRADAFPGPTC